MPQLQLPIFPAGVTPINEQIVVCYESRKVAYLHGHLALFQHAQVDSEAVMGYATTRSLERVAVAVGTLEAAPIRSEVALDVAHGGVLLALPALLAMGLLRFSWQFYSLPKGFCGIESKPSGSLLRPPL